MIKTFSLIVLALWVPVSAQAENQHDVYVKDADSFVLDGIERRLHAIDALERGQVCKHDGRVIELYESGRTFLKNILTQGNIRCEHLSYDKNNRSVANCYQDGKNINHILVTEGYAYANPYYSTRYVAAEEIAKNNNKGVHQCDDGEKPWEYRKRMKNQQTQG